MINFRVEDAWPAVIKCAARMKWTQSTYGGADSSVE